MVVSEEKLIKAMQKLGCEIPDWFKALVSVLPTIKDCGCNICPEHTFGDDFMFSHISYETEATVKTISTSSLEIESCIMRMYNDSVDYQCPILVSGSGLNKVFTGYFGSFLMTDVYYKMEVTVFYKIVGSNYVCSTVDTFDVIVTSGG